MSQRRMFSQQIVCSDTFIEMPPSTQALYFHLSMRADDDGFVSPKIVVRMIGSTEDELKVLIAKRFLLAFESGVVVIKHWLIHNLIRADMYKETMHLKEKKGLGLNEYGAYTELRDGVSELRQIEAPTWLKKRRKEVCTANVPQTVHRLGKVRLGKDSKDDQKFDQFWEKYPRKVGKKTARQKFNKIDSKLYQDMFEALEKHKKTDQWKKGFIPHPTTWLNGERWNDECATENELGDVSLRRKL